MAEFARGLGPRPSGAPLAARTDWRAGEAPRPASALTPPDERGGLPADEFCWLWERLGMGGAAEPGRELLKGLRDEGRGSLVWPLTPAWISSCCRFNASLSTVTPGVCEGRAPAVDVSAGGAGLPLLPPSRSLVPGGLGVGCDVDDLSLSIGWAGSETLDLASARRRLKCSYFVVKIDVLNHGDSKFSLPLARKTSLKYRCYLHCILWRFARYCSPHSQKHPSS